MAARALTPALTSRANYPPSRAGKPLMRVEPARGHSATCQWCCKPLTGKAEKWCSPVCRSSASRRKHSEAIKALASIGIPKQQAAAVVARYGLPAIEDKLNALGWYYYGRLKAWYFDGTEQRRAA
jgi:hypothetical protein